MNNRRIIPIIPYYSKDLAKIYNITPRKFRALIRELEPELGQRLGYLFTPKQVGIIVEKLNKEYTPDPEIASRIKEERR